MSNYELNKHKKSDKIKWVITGVAFVLVFVMLAGICLQFFGKGKLKPSEWFEKSDTDQTTSDDENKTSDGMIIDTEITAEQMRVTAKILSASEYSDYGVSPIAENAYTLTAEVLPDYASDKSLDWAVSWRYADSEWATGKTVTDYVTVTPTTDGAQSAVVACLQDFGEPINLTVTSRSNPLVCGVVEVNYYQRLKSLNYSFTLDGETVNADENNGVYKVDYTGEKKNYAVEIVPEYSAYTLTDMYSTEISGALTSTFGYTAATSFTALEIPAGLTGGDPELTENAVNWCNWVKRDEFDKSWGWEYIDMNRVLMLGHNVDAYGHILKPVYILTAEEKAHPRCAYYISLISDNDNFANEAAFNMAKDRFNNYTPSAYTFMDNVSVANYNDFVSAVKKCNNAGVGVIQYTIKIVGTYSTYETVLNLGYNDEFKVNVSDINMSDTMIPFLTMLSTGVKN